jgi:GxxExxY protein
MNDEKDPQTYAVIGAAMDVHTQLGCGFLEPVYQEAMEIELAARNIPFRPQVELGILYKGQPLRCKYVPDFICFESVIVELKALGRIGGIEEAQVLNYLKATGFHVGLLLNFGCSSLQYKRFVR